MSGERWAVVQDLFWEARSLPRAERDRVLAGRVGADAALLAEVHRLLDADVAEGILDRPTPAIASLGSALEAPVADRVGPYLLTEEIGRGAMGVVYRAYDPRLRREVALKFLHGTSSEDSHARKRFIDEARAASMLDHPHNCPVYDIGTAEDGRLYIAMAFCAGGSLATRLQHGPLPVAEAVRVAAHVADALDAAHRAGIVHRDIKPGNIAFTDRGDARVLDFGVAVLGEHEWASPRVAAGTPAYMAPEQVRGESVDRRTDIWALGVVVYEMITGKRPFAAADRHALGRAITSDVPDDPRRYAPMVPPRVASAVLRALSKNPADRFAGAKEFAAALSSERGDVAERQTRRRRIATTVAAAVVLAAGGGAIYARVRATPVVPIDDRAVAVLPFRVRGDPAIEYLREGMVDLLAAKLTGEGGLRATDPRAVYGALRRMPNADSADLTAGAAVSLARGLGAGNALLGDVVGTPSSLVVNASIVNSRGSVVSRASAQGEHTDLSGMIDGLVAQLLTQTAGEEPQRLGTLMSTSLPALRAYLEGQAAYRRGRYAESMEKYARALDFDSTFALAGLGLSFADGWVGTRHARDRGRSIAWRHRARLSARDRALVVAHVGSAYPRQSTVRDMLDAIDVALRSSPDRVELWYALGDIHFHFGRIIGDGDWERAAEYALRRAVRLDSTFAPSMHHLIALYARQRRTAELREIARVNLTVEPSGPTADYVRWRAGDGARAARESAAAALDSMASETLGWIAMNTVDDGVDIELGRLAAKVRGARPGTREQHLERLLSVHADALNSGRPADALAISDAMRAVQPDSTFHLRLRVLSAMYGDGDRDAADRAVATLREGGAEGPRELNRCVAEQWRLYVDPAAESRGSSPSAPGIRARGHAPTEIEICRAAIDAIGAARRRDAQADKAIADLDALYRRGPVEFFAGDGHVEYVPIVVSRLLANAGDLKGALEAIRRRPYFIGWQPFLAASLLAEARLATAIGDSAGAVRALEHHLALRANHDVPLRESTLAARQELARLRPAAR